MMPILPFSNDFVRTSEIGIPMQPIRCDGFITAWRFYALVQGQVSPAWRFYALVQGQVSPAWRFYALVKGDMSATGRFHASADTDR